MNKSVALDLVVVAVPLKPPVDRAPGNRADPLPDMSASGEPPKSVQDAVLIAVFEKRGFLECLGKGSPFLFRRRYDTRGVFPPAELEFQKLP